MITVPVSQFASAPRPRLTNAYLGAGETAIVVELVAAVEPKVVVEFGVNLGKTARAILDAAPSIERYVGIDVPPGFLTRLTCQSSEVPFNTAHCVAADPRFFLCLCERGSSELGPDDLEPADAVFIDGDHSFAGVAADSDLAAAIVRPGGVVVWHDYGNPAVEVTAVLDRLVADGWPIRHVESTWLAYMMMRDR
jgi:predicted O-methyltransferase YrrM